MRPHRVLVCALTDAAVAAARAPTTPSSFALASTTASSALSAAAALHEQRRPRTEQSRPNFAPRRPRSSVRKNYTKKGASDTPVPEQATTASPHTIQVPTIDPEPRKSAAEKAQHQHVGDASPLKVTEGEAASVAITGGSSGDTFPSRPMFGTGRDAEWKQERLRLAKLRHGLLVGAHSALQSTAGEDCRAHAPRLSFESLDIANKNAAQVAPSGVVESDPVIPLARLRVTLPSPPQCADSCGATSSPSAAPQLSAAEALRIFANTFALTLHSTPQQWRTRVSATTAPALPVFASPSSIPIAGAALSSSFLCSPLAIVAAPVAVGSVAQRAIAAEETAPLRWLETSFLDLCERLLRELYDGHANVTQPRDLLSSVRDQAAAVLRVVDKECRAANSHVLRIMQRQCRRDAAVAATRGGRATGAPPRKRKLSRAPKDTNVEDTLQNTLERVGQELHLVHAWIIHLCGDTAVPAAAVCVARRALRWEALRGTVATSTVTLDDVRWWFAVALLEHLHTQSYCFHHAKATAVDDISAADGGKARTPPVVVEAHHLRGLAALVDFAMAQRLEVPLLHTTQLYSSGTETLSLAVAAQQEALLDVLLVYHTLLPTYALLLPSYHRAVVVAATSSTISSKRRYTVGEVDLATPLELVLADDEVIADANQRQVHQAIAAETEDGTEVENGDGSESDAVRKLANRCAVAASPLRVWDVLVQHWGWQQEQVRSEGAAAAVWWLRMLPLWISTATDALELRLILVSSSSSGGGGGITDALRTAEPMKVLVHRAAALLHDALRFDRRDYEQSRGVPPPLTTRSASARGDASPLGDNNGASRSDKAGKAREASGCVTATAGAAGNREGRDALDDADEIAADAPPPLRRQRGKRSLFYKSPHEADGVLVRENQDTLTRGCNNGMGSSTRSRFESRSRTGAGFAVKSASFIPGAFGSTRRGAGGDVGGAAHLRHGRAASASAGADRNTSPIFQALVLSSESPIILGTLFRLDAVRRQTCFEEAWAATVHAQSKLWRLLYALPPAAGAASEAANHEKANRATLLRNSLPVAVVSLVSAAAVAISGVDNHSSQYRAAATPSSPASAPVQIQEETLRRVLCALQSAQDQLGLSLFESLHHLLAAVAQVLLRIERVSDSTPSSPRIRREFTAGKRAPLDHVFQRQAFIHVLTIGAAILLAGNSLPWESAQAAWQVQQQLCYPRIELQPGAAAPQLLRPRFVSAAMDNFAVQWTKAIARDLSLLHISCRQHADVVLANALESLRVLQTSSTSAALPLFAQQVTAVGLLRSLSVLAGQWRQCRDATQKGFRLHQVAGLAEVRQEGVKQLYQGILDLLRDDGALRLLCCYPAFVGELFEIHVRLKADLAPLTEWADTHLLPSVLPVVVAGLQRSQSTHNAATHADVCEATLGLLSQLSRYAANPKMPVVEVVRTRWNQVLLQVSLYCIRTAGRGGRKRAPDYGLPPPVLPSLDDITAPLQQQHGADSAATTAAAARKWVEAFTGGREPLFLALLDRSEILLKAQRGMQFRTIEVADGTTSALAAYIAAWDQQVRFGRRVWDTGRPVSHEYSADDPAFDTSELLAHLQATYEEVQAFSKITSPALRASAEEAPFMAAKPNNTRQLGFLVRFMEQHLRVQERLSRLSDDEVESFMLPWRKKDVSVPPAVQAVPRPSPSSPSSSFTASAVTVSETAPLVLLDFVGYLSSRSVWAMVTWACNIAETVVKIELKRHRHIPEAVQAVATTAILSQLRAVPAPPRGVGKPPVNILRALIGLSDIVAGTTESLLGYHRRSVIRGLVSNPTRDQYRVITFGLKQATAYVQEEAQQYQGLGTQESDARGGDASALADSDTAEASEGAERREEMEEADSAGGALHFRMNADGTIDRTWLAADVLGLPAPPRQQDVGIYYVKVWAAYAAQQRLRAASGEASTAVAATLTPYLRTDLNREYRFFLSCLVCLIDASMESALLYLRRLQGDGEEDIRLLVEATVSELCHTVSATIHSLLSLTPEVRRACCQREESELLWASLCIISTISAVVPRDPQERLFTPRCTDAIGRVFSLTRRLVDDAISIREAPAATNDEADSNEARDGAAISEAGASLVRRPLSTALVRGAQLLMRDPQSSQRTAIRLAMRQRERDDLSAILVALQVLVKSAAAYEPGRSLLHYVWARLAAELSQSLLDPSAVTSNATPTELNAAATVISRSEYGAALRGLASACAPLSPSSVQGGNLKGDETGDGAAKSALALSNAGGSAVAEAGLVVCDVAAAVRHVVEDAAGIEEERRRCLNTSANEEEWHYAGVVNTSRAASPASSGGLTSPLLQYPDQDMASEHPTFSVTEVMESGAVPATAIVDAVIAHAAATVRAAGGRSSLDINSLPGVERFGPATAGEVDDVKDDPAAAVGFLRLVKEFQHHVTELLSLVPLRDIVARPQAEVVFACMSLLHGTVSATAEDRVWALMTTKWRAELLTPSEPTFLQLQELELAKVRELRAVALRDLRSVTETHSRDSVNGVGHSNSSSTSYGSLPWGASVVDMFAATGRAPKAGSAQANDELSVLAAAERSMRHHWCAEEFDLPRHDDVSRLLPNAGGAGKSPRNADRDRRSQQQQRNGDRASSLEFDLQATGMASLAAMPDPIPIPVVLTIIKVLSRRPVKHAVPGFPTGSAHTFDAHGGGTTLHQIEMTASWLANGGNDGSNVDGESRQDSEVAPDSFTAFAEVFLTYTARAYWLLRPRLDDSAWVVLAIMEKSMAVYPTDNGVRQREWDRVCRQWRLPVSLNHAQAVAGQFFTGEQRRYIKAWTAVVRTAASSKDVSTPVSTKRVEGAEEVTMLRYLQAAALYLHLLAMTMLLLSRLGMFGDLPKASIEVVRRRVQAQVLQHRSPGSRSAAAASVVSKEALTRELTLMALERQTQPHNVNRNLFESAMLQLLNVLWCVVRHADSLTHTATDVVVARLQVPDSAASIGSPVPSSPCTTQPTAASAAAIVSYADHLRTMVVGVVQDTLDMVTGLGYRVPAMLPHHAVKTLLTSGFSCEPLTLRLPAHRTPSAATIAGSSVHSGHSSTHTDHTNSGLFAPAINVIATHLSATSSGPSPMGLDAALLPTPTSVGASLSATTELAVSNTFNLVARPELFVGSPTMLAILSPQFVRSTICRSLETNVTSSTLLPVASALEFYLSRHGVPLAPLLEATTELLTACTLRNSAVHMYCERLASELTSRKEFRQALAPPTIASAEQGAAGSISNEAVISFLAAIARRDVLVTKKTLAHLLHSVMRMRPDVFGQPPTENRQGKLTLVQVGTTVDSAIDTTNPLYTPAQPAVKRGSSNADVPRDSAAVMNAFNLEKWSDATVMTHRKALAALTISLPTVVEVAMHMDWMRPLDSSEWRRAIQMLKAADEARRERVAVHRSQVQAAIQQGHVDTEEEGEGSGGKKRQRTDSSAAVTGKLDASLHLEDPFDFAVGVLHLRYALRKIVHASLRRLLHQQGPRVLADVASILQMVDPALQRGTTTSQASSSVARDRDGGKRGGHTSSFWVRRPSVNGAAPSSEQPRLFDGVLAGTTRVLLSRAVLCAQAIGYDSTGAALEMSPRNGSPESQETQPVLKLPVPALQPSVVEAAISATASTASHDLRKGRHGQAGQSTGKIGQLSKEEKATVHQRVELERDAATTVGLTTAQLPLQSVRRIVRALRFTRRHVEMKQRKQEYHRRRGKRQEKPRFSTSAASDQVSGGYASLSVY
ncbi:hypothetical protein NXY56_002092 [Leishmania guyanensis]